MHEFQIMPTLDVEILVDVDLWARIRRSIPPPPIRPYHARALATTATAQTPRDEKTRFKNFLTAEMRLFEGVRGSTDRIEHRIQIKPTKLIKRYRPRNPAMQGIIDEEVAKM